jgi:hypothetical protein
MTGNERLAEDMRQKRQKGGGGGGGGGGGFNVEQQVSVFCGL